MSTMPSAKRPYAATSGVARTSCCRKNTTAKPPLAVVVLAEPGIALERALHVLPPAGPAVRGRNPEGLRRVVCVPLVLGPLQVHRQAGLERRHGVQGCRQPISREVATGRLERFDEKLHPDVAAL